MLLSQLFKDENLLFVPPCIMLHLMSQLFNHFTKVRGELPCSLSSCVPPLFVTPPLYLPPQNDDEYAALYNMLPPAKNSLLHLCCSLALNIELTIKHHSLLCLSTVYCNMQHCSNLLLIGNQIS